MTLGANAKYIRHTAKDFDPDNKLQPLELKEMQSEEVKGYMEAATKALEDAEKELESNSTNTNTSELIIDIDEVPFIVVQQRSNIRKGLDRESEANENEAKTRREKTLENNNIGLHETRQNDQDEVETDVTVE